MPLYSLIAVGLPMCSNGENQCGLGSKFEAEKDLKMKEHEKKALSKCG